MRRSETAAIFINVRLADVPALRHDAPRCIRSIRSCRTTANGRKKSGATIPTFSPSYRSDSRVPANEICGLLPGEVFVHRNVANIVVHSDLNCLSVMQYAVDVLKIRHIIICGHYGCGGVRAALSEQKLGLIDNWLRHVQDVVTKHRPYLECIADGAGRVDRLCELNVIDQAINAAQTTVVQAAWERGQPLSLHGWVYGLQDGLVRQLGIDISSPDDLRAAIATPWEERTVSLYDGKSKA
jgi:carbonic anhydrase